MAFPSAILKITPEVLIEFGVTPADLEEARKQIPKEVPDQHVAYLTLMSRRWYRLCNIYVIKDKSGNKIPFKPNAQQKYLFDNFHYLNLILKSRQHGVTTFLCLLFLDLCLFEDNIAAGIVAQTEGYARAFFDNKVKFAYDNLPEEIRSERKLLSDRNDLLKFSNGSTIYVDCSLRSHTVQYLHISEFGEVCATRPDKAQEIVSGALNTVTVGQYVFVEATGAGREGYFYDYCQEATKLRKAGKKLNPLQFKFFFIGAYCDKGNTLPADSVIMTKEDVEYFKTIKPEIQELMKAGIIMPMPGGRLSDDFKAWYVEKSRQQKDNMLSQHPLTPDEAFQNMAEGAYFRREMAHIHAEKKVMCVPYERNYPVNTSWDFGTRGYMTIWFHQYILGENRLIHYYENFGHDFAHYVGYMNKLEYAVWGTHYLPHDAKTTRLQAQTNTTYEKMLSDLGLMNIVVVERTLDKRMARNSASNFLGSCFFDEENCDKGVKRLEGYSRVWNNRKKEWRESEEESHGCLIAGTLIDTPNGKVRIENIRIGDYVTTPYGNNLVSHAGLIERNAEVYEISFNNGSKLTGTAEHKFFTVKKGLVKMDSLTYGDLIQSNHMLRRILWTIQSLLFSKVINMSYRDRITENIIGLKNQVQVANYTGRFGNIIMGRYLMDMKSIIKMKMALTTDLKILSCCLCGNTNAVICLNELPMERYTRPQKTLWQKLLNGIDRLKGSNGISKMGIIAGPIGYINNWFASYVGNHLQPEICEGSQNVVQNDAHLCGSIESQKIRKPENVSFVEKIIHVIKDQLDQLAPRVVQIEKRGKADVYDLTVEKDRCYFANGILVSNSDSFICLACGREQERTQGQSRAGSYLKGRKKPDRKAFC